ncbi:MAG: YigZ family protein [Arachidicoccus sp.]|nr:YigZ family protein [Arachidicoccus sp.]
MQTDFYKTIHQEVVAEFKDRGSKFLAYAFPVSDPKDVKNRVAKLKQEHPKAIHFCFAYRLGTDGNNFRCNDDGEPSGSAGKPILGQLDSKSVTNAAIIVVRYFGGTLLGVPGLINAYKTSSALALQLTPIVQKPVLIRCKINFDYTQMNEIQRRLKRANAEIVEQNMQLFCTITADIPKNNMDEIQLAFEEMNGVEFSKII